MDWTAFSLSLKLAFWTCVLILPVAILLARALAWGRFAGKSVVEAVVMLPLVLPPTVLGFYLLVGVLAAPRRSGACLKCGRSACRWCSAFPGMLVASRHHQPAVRGAADPARVRGHSARRARGGLRQLRLSRMADFARRRAAAGAGPASSRPSRSCFAHTLGEFGVVLMVGGNIPGETRMLSISIYDRVQAFDARRRGLMSAALLVLSLVAIALVHVLARGATLTSMRAMSRPAWRCAVTRRGRFRSTWTFACAPGELLALVGPVGRGQDDGAARHRRPPAAAPRGRIVAGADIWFDGAFGIMVPPQARAVGLVFQDYALFPHLSALDNVRLAMRHVGAPERAAEARLAAGAACTSTASRRASPISSRAASASAWRLPARSRAIRKVLLLDEPFSAVDRMTREPLKEELPSLRRSLAIPIVLVTHDLEEAQALADRICVIDRGRTLQTGTPDDVRLRPASALVARLTGQTNLFSGEVERVSAGGQPGRIRWGGRSLEVADTGKERAGARVTWLVPSDYVVAVDAAHQGEANVVHGRLTDVTRLGERTVLSLRVDADGDAPLRFTLATRDARNQGFGAGRPLSVRLLPEGIHLMPSAR